MSTYTTSSPLLRGVRVLQRNRVTEGLRLARRARLTYLKEANPNLFVVDESTKDATVRLAEALEKRRLQKAGKKASKKGGKLEEEEAEDATGGGAKGAAAPAAKPAAAPAAKPAAAAKAAAAPAAPAAKPAKK